MTTIGERITAARRSLIMIRASLAAMEGDSSLDAIGIPEEEMIESLAKQAEYLWTELHWLKLLPASVLDAPSPDDDEADKVNKDWEAGRATIVEAALLSRLAPAEKDAR